ncbi:PREDICTED: uncharacterized protein LOC108447830 [Corvus brachyrhynchos]|uniref:uncharacterized protein LOC108447830 n=1 Tax=Corvus brachyrhynchos TaxID=85066 RepID=UPI0008166F80|nr:PREDICTED: uncharacterized protein LOC108447830 [Corvus brachyrhynchos]
MGSSWNVMGTPLQVKSEDKPWLCPKKSVHAGAVLTGQGTAGSDRGQVSRKELFPGRVGRPGPGCPEQLGLPLDPWQCPRPGWTLGLGAAWDSGRCPCHGRGWEGSSLANPSQPKALHGPVTPCLFQGGQGRFSWHTRVPKVGLILSPQLQWLGEGLDVALWSGDKVGVSRRLDSEISEGFSSLNDSTIPRSRDSVDIRLSAPGRAGAADKDVNFPRKCSKGRTHSGENASVPGIQQLTCKVQLHFTCGRGDFNKGWSPLDGAAEGEGLSCPSPALPASLPFTGHCPSRISASHPDRLVNVLCIYMYIYVYTYTQEYF